MSKIKTKMRKSPSPKNPVTTWKNDETGAYDSMDDHPAVTETDGTKWWYKEGKLHREHKPAIIFPNGDEEWWYNDKLSRINGPARVYTWLDGHIAHEWWFMGKRHRDGGKPAIHRPDGTKEWWIRGIRQPTDSIEVYKHGKINLTTCSSFEHVKTYYLPESEMDEVCRLVEKKYGGGRYELRLRNSFGHYIRKQELLIPVGSLTMSPNRILSDGDEIEEWFLHGKLHREDGPAVILKAVPDRPASVKEKWCLYGKLHREGGPAVTCYDGTQRWYVDGNLHRTDGPAVIYGHNSKRVPKQEWWLKGHRLDLKKLQIPQPAKNDFVKFTPYTYSVKKDFAGGAPDIGVLHEDIQHRIGILSNISRRDDAVNVFFKRPINPAEQVILNQIITNHRKGHQLGKMMQQAEQEVVPAAGYKMSYKMMVHRLKPEVLEEGGLRINGYLQTFYVPTSTIFDVVEQVGKDYGGGKYVVNIVDSEGKTIKQKNFEIAGPAKMPGLQNSPFSPCSQSEQDPAEKEDELTSEIAAEKLGQLEETYMEDIRKNAHALVSSENLLRIQNLKKSLQGKTQANILELEAIQQGVEQPKKIDLSKVILVIAAISATIVALMAHLG